LPSHRLTEIRNFTEKGLDDFSISRLKEKMPWGIPVPDDSDHVMYVWFDALVNYISTLGWPDDSFNECWPGVQIAGKDNLRQQSNMWQAMLLSAGVKPSRQILIHGFITSEGQKMSKSLGNVVDPFEVAEQYGIDALRFYLLKEIPTSEDGDFNKDRFKVMYSELANNLGNLLSRVVAMNEKYFEGKVPPVVERKVTQDDIEQRWRWIDDAMTGFNLKEAMEVIGGLLTEGNKYVDDTKPWTLAKEGKTEALAEVMYVLLEGLRQVSWMLEPFIPGTAQKMRDQLGVTEKMSEGLDLREWGRLTEGTVTTKGDSLFPRLEEVK
jgi:methionyl-tRNA synthetase